MNEEKFAKYKSAFKIYGAVTHYIFYANRSIVVGFALEGKTPPTRRMKISLVDKGVYLGNLHPIHDIKPMGIKFCDSARRSSTALTSRSARATRSRKQRWRNFAKSASTVSNAH
jgi:hypothetical protein